MPLKSPMSSFCKAPYEANTGHKAQDEVFASQSFPNAFPALSKESVYFRAKVASNNVTKKKKDSGDEQLVLASL